MASEYKPTALYSFEFKERLNPFAVSEIFLLLPPESYQIKYGYRLTVHKTVGGSTVDWMGVDNPKITLSGSLWSPLIDVLPSPFGSGAIDSIRTGGGGILSGASTLVSKTIQSFSPLNQMSGLDEFFRIKFMLYDFFTKDSNLIIPSSLDSFGPLPGLKIMTLWSIMKKNNLADLQLIYHDYDDDVHWEVVPEGEFTVSRDQNDPFTAKWSIQLTGIKDVRILPFFVPSLSKKVNADAYMQQTAETLFTFSIAGISSSITSSYNLALQTVDEFEEINITETMEYGEAIRDYFDKRKDNINELKHQSDKYGNLAKDAGQGGIDAIMESVGLDPNDYADLSESPNPPPAVIDTGIEEIFKAIAEYILISIGLAGIQGYKEEPNVIKEGESGKTVNDIPPITEGTFNQSSTGDETVKVLYERPKWRTYVVKTNDTIANIASREKGDYDSFIEILKLNNLTVADFSNGSMVGKDIKIPEKKQTIFNNPGNLVYFNRRNSFSGHDKAKEEVLGRDMPLGTDRTFYADNSGDMPLSLPDQGFEDNIKDILNFEKGTLPLYTEWGSNIKPGQMNNLSKKVIISKTRDSLKIDPRVRDVHMDGDKIEVEGDAIRINSLVIYPLIGKEITTQRVFT